MSAATRTATPRQPQSGGFRRVWRTLKQLLHEVVGGIFAVLSLMWFNLAIRAWTRGATAHWIVGIAFAAAILFLIFSVTSFRRARKL